MRLALEAAPERIADKMISKRIFANAMSRMIIFIPKGETEPMTVTIHHAPDLAVPGIWNIVTNHVYLRTELWNIFPAGDQIRQRKIFDQLLQVSNDLMR